ncbi:MAG: PhzF family phenazine biosynthesis protein [Bacteroidota bacterium]
MKMYQIDAFTDQIFGGNPAAVVPLENWLPDALLQQIAVENNLSETAFIVLKENDFELRWFTPAFEVDLCGHATLATAYALFEHLGYAENEIRFHTKSGRLTVHKTASGIRMDFPIETLTAVEEIDGWIKAFGTQPLAVFQARAYSLAIFEDQAAIANLEPDQHALLDLPGIGHIASAVGNEVDFVSRFFAPKAGIPEDPVTGSAHCALVPYWAGKLGKTSFKAEQISARLGQLTCTLEGDRVWIEGQARTYMIGDFEIR